MFSQAVPPTQVAAAFSQFSTVIGHLRQGFSTTAIPRNHSTSGPSPTAVSGKHRAPNLRRSTGRRRVKGNKQKNRNVSTLNTDECVAVLMKEENLSKILPLLNVTVGSSIQNNPWAVSHISSKTFYENRNGFPEGFLEGTERKSIQLMGLDNKPLITLQVPVFHQQRRYYGVQGFGTKRPQTKSQENENKSSTDQEEGGTGFLLKKGKKRDLEDVYVQDLKSKELMQVISKGIQKSRSAFSLLTLGLILMFFYLMREILIQRDDGKRPGSLGLFDGSDYDAEDVKVTFDDVRGVDEAKQELEEAVQFLKFPQKFTSIGAKLPKGVLLVGKPGIGKTLLAKAVAGEAGVPFFYASGAEFDDLFVGSGARKVRKLFTKAKRNAPCVVFIDEIDSAGAKRTSSTIHPYANQTINQLLADMDGFHSSEGIIVIGATNKRENLDEALLRPGRFDVEVNVRPPDTKGREDIFRLYLDKVKWDPKINVRELAEATPGMTGADVSNVVNQAALRAAIVGSKMVTWDHLDYAVDKIRMGPAWKNKRLLKKDLRNTAYHEAGHTLITLFTNDAPKLSKVTILPRGKALGVTQYLPESDAYSQTKSQMLAFIDIAMGGRVAEEMIFGENEVTSGASSDFQQATQLAQAMVEQYGMSEKAGFRTVGKRTETGPEHKKMIDSEIEKILKESHDRVKVLLNSKNKELERLATALLKYGTLNKEEVQAVIKGQKLTKQPDALMNERHITST